MNIDQCVQKCGNGVIDPGEQCEPPGGGNCGNNCQIVLPPPPPPKCPANCNDNNPCTVDGCNANTKKCFNNPLTGPVCRPTPLNNHPVCNPAELCLAGACPADGGNNCPPLEVAANGTDGKAWLGPVNMTWAIVNGKGGVPPLTVTMTHNMPTGQTSWFQADDSGTWYIPNGIRVTPAVTAANGSNTAMGRFFAQFIGDVQNPVGPNGRDYEVKVKVTDAAGQKADASDDFNVAPLVADVNANQVCSCWEGSRNCDMHMGNLGPDPAPDVNSTTTLEDIQYNGEFMTPTVVNRDQLNSGNWQGAPGAVIFGGNNQVAYGNMGNPIYPGGELAGWPLLEITGAGGGARQTAVSVGVSHDPNLANNVTAQKYSTECKEIDGPDDICLGDPALFSASVGAPNTTQMTFDIPLDPCFDPATVTALQPAGCAVQGNTIHCNLAFDASQNNGIQISYSVTTTDDCEAGTVATTQGTLAYGSETVRTDVIRTTINDCSSSNSSSNSRNSSNGTTIPGNGSSNNSSASRGSNGSNRSNISNGSNSSGSAQSGSNRSSSRTSNVSSRSSNPSLGSSSVQSSSRRSSSNSSTSSPGQCRGDECFLGGNAACAVQGLICSPISLLPCIRCINPSSASSSRSSIRSSSQVSSRSSTSPGSSQSSRSSTSSVSSGIIGECRTDECARGGNAFCANQSKQCRGVVTLPCIECFGGSSAPPSSSSLSSANPSSSSLSSVNRSSSSSSVIGCTDNYQCPSGLCIDGTCAGCDDSTQCPIGQCVNGTCPQCLENLHCPSGLCINETCVECTANEQCRSGICIDGKCSELECSSDLQCPSRLCIDGMCSGCVLDNECASGRCDSGVCAALGCTANEQCKSGLCIDGICASCQTNDQCVSNQCEDGVCVEPQTAAEALPAQLIDLPIAADCMDGTQCASGMCVNGKCEAPAATQFSTPTIPGMTGCQSDRDCRAGQRCLNGRCENLVACVSHTDCRPGQQCVGGRCMVSPTGAPTNAQTGPGVIAVMAAGAAAGFAWMRRRKLA